MRCARAWAWTIRFLKLVHWSGDIVRGDFGRSLLTDQPTLNAFMRASRVTLELGILSIVIGLLIAIPLGMASAAKQVTPVDWMARVVATIGVSAPDFWIGTAFVVFAGRCGPTHRTTAREWRGAWRCWTRTERCWGAPLPESWHGRRRLAWDAHPSPAEAISGAVRHHCRGHHPAAARGPGARVAYRFAFCDQGRDVPVAGLSYRRSHTPMHNARPARPAGRHPSRITRSQQSPA
jgi:hypothetical protein